MNSSSQTHAPQSIRRQEGKEQVAAGTEFTLRERQIEVCTSQQDTRDLRFYVSLNVPVETSLVDSERTLYEYTNVW